MNIPKDYRLVKVASSGVQFGNAWYSHESITGYSADQMNQGTCCVTGGAYMRWLSEETHPQPIYDEEKERELFEAVFPPCYATVWREEDREYYSELYPDQGGQDYQRTWDGWKACAQSRAKAGEVGHE